MSRQADYSSEIWDALSSDFGIRIVDLPGKENPSLSANSFVFAASPLQNYVNLPNADRFMDRYKVPPSAIIKLGREALVAMTAEVIPIPN